MSRRPWLPILLTPVVIVLFAVGTMAAGNAGTQSGGWPWPGWPTPTAPPWPGTPICAEGTLAFVGVHESDVTLAGSIRPCTGTDPAIVAGARWGVARYHTQRAVINETGVRRFDSATAPAAFESRITLGGVTEASWGPVQAACLITAPKVRLACVEITTDWNGTLRVAPIPLDDPRVIPQVTIVRYSGPDPECGACV